MTSTSLARIGYVAYGMTTDFTHQGAPMPAWDELPPKIQQAWRNVARRVFSESIREMIKAGELLISPDEDEALVDAEESAE